MSAEPSTIGSLRRRGLFLAVFVLTACDSDSTPIVHGAAATDKAVLDRDTTRLGPNDRVRITVFGQPTLTAEYSLDGNGVLAFPLIGNVPASGSTAAELQRTIAAKLSPDYLVNPSVSVEIVTRRPFYVIGEVLKPGNYPYVTDLTAINAVAMAGGFTRRARKSDFYIRRIGTDGTMVRIEANAGTVLQPGDTLEVRERMF
ncbi:MAG TPA: polysaccharide biosynthesis/export family protein [Reyranella sp.]|jgi:polysaccharide export outer membrane protein|nr:polysaccharide biosynthesis/export family protein [Reyranella sp.]